MVPREPPYPPPPRHAPAGLGRQPGGLRLGRALGLAGNLVGVSLFLAAPLLSAWAAWVCLLASESSVILRLGGFIVCTAFTLIYLKSFLPRRVPLPPGLVPISADDEPTAHAFIARVAADIDAPAPRSLYVGPRTDLRLAARLSPLDLIRGPAWEIHVGLWLWQGVSLSELQALVARTLAPLSRGRLERFRVTVRAVLDALTGGADRLDDASTEPGSVVFGLARAIRGLHVGATLPLRILGRFFLWLDASRQGTFADDQVAVRVAGSDAVVHAILRSDFAAAALREYADALRLAADDGAFTRDLYAHVPDAATTVREAHNDFTLGDPPVLRGPNAGKYADVFEPGQRYRSLMWHGFPPPDEREQHAKGEFVAAERDDRPAADLFDNPGQLRERLTAVHYVSVLRAADDYLPLPPETVRHWIATRGDPIIPEKYAGCYDGGRRLDPGTPAERDAAVAGDTWDAARLIGTQAGLYANARERAADWRTARKSLARLLRRTVYRPAGRDLAIAEDLADEIRKARRWLAALDRWAYVVHVHMAARLDDLALHDDLLNRYESVLRFQPLADDAKELRNRADAFVRRLADFAGAPPYRLVRDANREFAASRRDLGALLAEAERLHDPLLQEWTGPVPLHEFLYAHEELPARADLTTEQFGRLLLSAWGEIASKALWLHRLGVAALLNLHEQIASEFTTKVGLRAGVLVPGPPAETIPDAIVLEPAPNDVAGPVLELEPEETFADEAPDVADDGRRPDRGPGV
jgi:hypothetical protein